MNPGEEDNKMSQVTLQVYDTPMCCASGVCGPQVDPKPARFAADLDWVERQGVAVRRYNPSQEPEAFLSNPAVLSALQSLGSQCLPLVIWEGKMLAAGGYPDRATLERALGLSPIAATGGAA